MPAWILSALRSPRGAFGGALRDLGPAQLASPLAVACLERAGLPPGALDELILGCCLQAGTGPNPARQAAANAGLPVPAAHSPNQGLASGLKALDLACQSLALGRAWLILAGGADSASRAPYLLPSARWGAPTGSAPLLDSLLTDAGVGAERPCRPQAPAPPGAILPISCPTRRGPRLLAEDEAPEAPSPALGDGAALLLLAPGGAPPPPVPALGRLLGCGEGPDAPAALRRLWEDTGLTAEQVDLWDAPDGPGSLPPGPSPLGAEGPCRAVDLLHALRQRGLRHGVLVLEGEPGTFTALALEHTP